MHTPVLTQAVSTVISGYPHPVQEGVLTLRTLIYRVAKGLPQVSSIEEALRWGQPSYLTPKNVGTTLRIGPHPDATFAIYTHCQTTVIAGYAQAFPGWDKIDGNRAVLFDTPDQIEPERLSHLIRHALTYHLNAFA